MTGHELVQAIQSLGGRLTLEGDEIDYFIPVSDRGAGELLDLLRAQREAVIEVLRQRADGVVCRRPFAESMARWMLECCVLSSRCASNPSIMYREYCRWAQTNRVQAGNDTDCLRKFEGWGFALDETGMLGGLALGEDFIAACNYERLCSLPPARSVGDSS